MSRTSHSVNNITAGFINKILLNILPFASRTAIIYILGSEYLGISSLFSSILMVLNLADLGIGTALVYSMHKPIAENNIPKLRALLSAYKKCFRLIGGVIFILGIIILPFLRSLIKGDVPDGVNLYFIYFGNLFYRFHSKKINMLINFYIRITIYKCLIR